MRLLVGIDDTDSSRGWCTTYLAHRIATDVPAVEVLPYPRLVRLNPNVPFKTRGNAAVCLEVEALDPGAAFEGIRGKVRASIFLTLAPSTARLVPQDSILL